MRVEEDEAMGVGAPRSVSPEAVEVLEADEGRARSGCGLGDGSRPGDDPGSDIVRKRERDLDFAARGSR